MLAALKGQTDLILALEPCLSRVGGGSLPDTTLPSWAVTVSRAGSSEAELEQKLRLQNPPVVGRIEVGRVWLDLRTVLDHQDQTLVEILVSVAKDSLISQATHSRR
jgi:L-seryl-tRNA(Ser) seleniumtransferase